MSVAVTSASDSSYLADIFLVARKLCPGVRPIGLANDPAPRLRRAEKVQRTRRGPTPRPELGAPRDANFFSPMQDDHRSLEEL
jgi:hypothetical protein